MAVNWKKSREYLSQRQGMKKSSKSNTLIPTMNKRTEVNFKIETEVIVLDQKIHPDTGFGHTLSKITTMVVILINRRI